LYADIRIGSPSATNTLAYYDTDSTTTVKRFIVQTLGSNETVWSGKPY